VFGASFGLLAQSAGMGAFASVVMSATTFAGSAQFAAASAADQLAPRARRSPSRRRDRVRPRPVHRSRRPDHRGNRGLPGRLGEALSTTWLVVAIVGAGTIALKAIGPVLLGGRSLPSRLAGVVEMLAPALLAALVVTQAVGADRRLVFDERLLGIAAAIVAIRLRAPLLAVVLAAAGVTALARFIGD
jgi:predicted branched-subunit amino acid permease